MKRLDSNDVDTALCIWEHILERLSVDRANKGEDDTPPVPASRWERYRASNGTATLRGWCTEQIDIVNNAWQIASCGGEEFGGCFDWDFVPAFMERAYDDELELLPEWEDIAESIREESQA